MMCSNGMRFAYCAAQSSHIVPMSFKMMPQLAFSQEQQLGRHRLITPAYSAPAEIASFLQVAAALLLPLLLLLERQPIRGEPRRSSGTSRRRETRLILGVSMYYYALTHCKIMLVKRC
ncbi:hypothetical protein E2562_022693 [Oryza meyeriana var. granulata]|uniref:Uncharacterized protein n=1 Tax=Oryza meyeriana var. granulata TaxID=110450 RepID=A0A6G1E0K3_9ORYZ|nr:hypothetical protein E2562_022693 [Oryza meyeriana var. granulata]